MDFLDIVMELRKQHGIDVPEAEYRELESLDSCANYLCLNSRLLLLLKSAPSFSLHTEKFVFSPLSVNSNHYDVVVIGAGLSGLSAAVRLGMFEKKVLLLEKHYVVGGLNSFYAKGSKKFDVGLHALTNYPSEHSGKKSPLLKLCRQLRIPFDSLNLHEQSHSRISFPGKELVFNNYFPNFIEQINQHFPKSIDSFSKHLKKMEEFPAYSVDAPEISTREILANSEIEPLLGEIYFAPPVTMVLLVLMTSTSRPSLCSLMQYLNKVWPDPSLESVHSWTRFVKN